MPKSTWLRQMKKYRNSVWAIAEYLAYPALLLLTTKHFLHFLGDELYGIWMFLNAVVGIGSLITVGTVGSIIKLISTELAQKCDQNKILDTVNSALAISLSAGAVAATIIVIIFAALGSHIFPEMGDATTLTLIGLVAATLLFLDNVDSVFASSLKAAEKFGKSARIEIAFKTIQILLCLAVARCEKNIELIFIVLLITSSARTLTKMYGAKAVLGIKRLRPKFNAETTNILTYAKWGWLHGAGGLLFAVSDRLLVGAIMGPKALAHYAIMLMIPQQIHSLIAAASSVYFPRVSNLLSRGDISQIRLLKVKLYWFAFLASSITLLAIAYLSQPIFRIWLGSDLPDETMRSFIPLCVAFLILSILVPPYYLLLGLGHARYVGVLNLTAGIIMVVVMMILGNRFGLMGFALGKIVFALVLLTQFQRVERIIREYGINEQRAL